MSIKENIITIAKKIVADYYFTPNSWRKYRILHPNTKINPKIKPIKRRRKPTVFQNPIIKNIKTKKPKKNIKPIKTIKPTPSKIPIVSI